MPVSANIPAKDLAGMPIWDLGPGVSPGQLADYINGNVDVSELENEIYNRYSAAFGGKLSPEQAARARDLAERTTRKITGDLAKAELNNIADAIQHGAAEGMHPDQVARYLNDIQELDRGRAATFRDFREAEQVKVDAGTITQEQADKRIEKRLAKLVRDRRKVIAQNEMRLVSEAANRDDADARGARFKGWLTTGDAKVSDGCLENEAQGMIPIDKAHKSGHMEPSRHPRCRCSEFYATSDAAKARAEKVLKENSSARLVDGVRIRGENGKVN